MKILSLICLNEKYLVYYREIADKAREEHYNPVADEVNDRISHCHVVIQVSLMILKVSMDLVRLTDEETIEDLVFDASDSFYWLRQQALRGVAAAQVCLIHQIVIVSVFDDDLASPWRTHVRWSPRFDA